MIALALDVGHNTGFVVGEVSRRMGPRLLYSTTYGLQSLFDPQFFDLTMTDLKQNKLVLDTIVLELPVTDQFSSDASVTLSTRVAWDTWANMYQTLYPKTELRRISASTWKSTPSIMINIFKMQVNYTNDWYDYKPSRHENDASKMLHWLAHYGYNQ